MFLINKLDNTVLRSNGVLLCAVMPLVIFIFLCSPVLGVNVPDQANNTSRMIAKAYEAYMEGNYTETQVYIELLGQLPHENRIDMTAPMLWQARLILPMTALGY
jgi:hypothetical protein